MIDTFYLYQSFQSVVNTYFGGWFRPNTDFINAVNNFSNEIWEIETRRAEKSQEARDNLTPFLAAQNILCDKANSSYSVAPLPKDYGRFASAKVMVADQEICVPCDEVNDGQCSNGVFSDEELAEDYYNTVTPIPVQLVDEQRWTSAMNHVTKKPGLTITNPPKMNQIGTKDNSGNIVSVFRVSPRDVSVLTLSYYVRPTDATFVYTKTPGNVQTGAGDEILYDKDKSVKLQWPSTMINEFLWRLGERYGLFTRDQFLTAITNKEKVV